MPVYDPTWADDQSFGTIGPYTPSWAERLRGFIQDTMQSAGASRGYAQTVSDNASDVANIVPVLGNALSANQAYRDYKGGNYLGAAINAAGAIPLPGAGPAEEAAETAAKDIAKGIIAYHGSPHTFDQFDASKIGTGEGAQAYGHGLYFAEAEPVAREYQKNVTSASAPMRRTFLGKEVDPESPEYHAASLLSGNGRSLRNVRQEVAGWINNAQPGEDVDHYNKVANVLAQASSKGDFGELPAKGHMYQVAIHAHPDEFLDWDKPLSEQPDIHNKLSQIPEFQSKQAMIGGDRMIGLTRGTNIKPLVAIKLQSELQRGVPYEQAITNVKGLTKDQNWSRQVDDLASLIGEHQIEMANVLPKDWMGNAIGRDVDSRLMAQKLSAAGIKGIRYLDQASRGNYSVAKRDGDWGILRKDGGDFTPHRFADKAEADKKAAWMNDHERTHNYVVFDPATIEILKRYGLLGMGGAAGAAAYESQSSSGSPDLAF